MTDKLSIIFCQPTMNFSGSEVSLKESIIALHAIVESPIILAGADGPMRNTYTNLGAKIYVVNAPKLSRKLTTFPSYLVSFYKVYIFLRRFKPINPIIYVNTLMFPQAFIASKLLGYPTLTHIREVQTTYPKLIYRSYLCAASLCSNRLILVCEAIARDVSICRDLLQRIALVIYNTAPHAESVVNLPYQSKPVILAVMPLTIKKGAIDLVLVAKHLKDLRGCSFHLLVVGRDAEPETLSRFNEMIGELGLKSCITLVGEVREPSKYFRTAQILLQTSHSEACPRAIIEALSYGLPVVATSVGGTSEIVKDAKNGYCCDKGDVRSMAHRLNEILSDEVKWENFSKNSLFNFEEKYSRSVYQKHLIHIIQSLNT